jgi:predicted DNA-binding protein
MADTRKVLVTMSDELLERVDREARRLGKTRSDFLQEAAERQLSGPDPKVIEAALERGQAALDGIGSFESAEVIRADRDERDARDRHR